MSQTSVKNLTSRSNPGTNSSHLLKQSPPVAAQFENIWDIIDQSRVGNLNSVERSTAIATYAAFFGLVMNLEGIEEIMIGALLSDLGILELKSGILKKLRNQEPLEPSEHSLYIQHPVRSVEMILDRKIQVSQTLRKMIAMSHEP